MIKKQEAYRVQCDRCKAYMASLADDCIFSNESEAAFEFCKNGWTAVHVETDRTITYHFCPKCMTEVYKAIDKLTSASFKKEK